MSRFTDKKHHCLKFKKYTEVSILSLKVLLNYHKQCQQVFAVFFKLNPEFQGCERITS